jgi:hypothetical protein
MRALWRILIVIPAGFIAASIAASAVIVLAAGVSPNLGEPAADFAAKLLLVGLIGAMFVGAVVAVPALVMIVLAEVFSWRSLILHLLFGAGIGFVAFLAGIGGEPPASAQELQLGAAAGAVGGFVYWLVSGRRAGRRLGRDARSGRDNEQVRHDRPAG